MATTLYGCISEYGVYNELQERIKKHNDSIIESLPQFDEWPPLTRQMFAVTQDSDYLTIPPTYEYWGRTFHFGGRFKSIEYEWKEWRQKFEILLTKLVWQDSFISLQLTPMCRHSNGRWIQVSGHLMTKRFSK
jgi:hypothetical protein